MAELTELTEKYDIQELKNILSDYVRETGSAGAQALLDHFEEHLPFFKKVIPYDYKRILTAVGHFEESGMTHEAAELEAFHTLYA